MTGINNIHAGGQREMFVKQFIIRNGMWVSLVLSLLSFLFFFSQSILLSFGRGVGWGGVT